MDRRTVLTVVAVAVSPILWYSRGDVSGHQRGGGIAHFRQCDAALTSSLFLLDGGMFHGYNTSHHSDAIHHITSMQYTTSQRCNTPRQWNTPDHSDAIQEHTVAWSKHRMEGIRWKQQVAQPVAAACGRSRCWPATLCGRLSYTYTPHHYTDNGGMWTSTSLIATTRQPSLML